MSAWWALLAIPAILAIHWFRRALPRRTVTALWLWGERHAAPVSGRKRERLIDRTSLRWELLAALALLLALVDPRWFDRPPARHLVVVLDTRLSLLAQRQDGLTVAERLTQDLTSHLATLAPDDRVTVITSGTPPRVLVGPAVPRDQATLGLTTWKTDQTWHDLAPALDLAREVAGPTGSVLLASDRPDPAAAHVGTLLRGEVRPTAGLIAARWRPGNLHLRLAAWGQPQRREVRITGPAGELAQRTVELVPGHPLDVNLPLTTTTPIDIHLDGPDPQPADDHVHLLPPQPRQVRWWCPEPGPLRRALEAQDSARPAPPAEADLVVGPGPRANGAWRITVEPGDAPPTPGPFLARSGHPWLEGIDATGCRWAGGVPLEQVPVEEVLLAAGTTALLREAPDHHLIIHADLTKGTLADHPAWPALLAQVVSDRHTHLPGRDDRNLDPGTVVRLVLPPGAEALVVDDSGILVPGADHAVLLPVPERAGLHTLGVRRNGLPEPWLTISVSPLDARLGDLTPCVSGDQPAPAAPGSTATAGRHPLLALLAASLAGLALVASWRAQRREDGP